MTALAFEVLSARTEPYAAVPTLSFRLRITESSGAIVHALALRCQIRIEPQLRTYVNAEEDRLVDLFGETARWGETLRPFLWTHVSLTVTGFAGSTEVDLQVTCTYDFEVAGTKYLHALEDGDIPIVLLFAGTAFTNAMSGFSAEPIPWDQEASFRLPVAVWRTTMDHYFPNSGWARMSRDTLDALSRFKSQRALPTWDQAIAQLLKEAGADPP